MSEAAAGRLLLRHILREIKQSYNGQMSFTKAPAVRFVFDEFRYNQVTDAQTCAREHEARLTAETYLDYLKSVKEHLRLIEKYKSRERSTEEAARLVGLELPGKSEGVTDPKH